METDMVDAMKSLPSLWIVIPCFNEESVLRETPLIS